MKNIPHPLNPKTHFNEIIGFFALGGRAGGGGGGRADLLIPPSLMGKTPKIWGLLLKSRGTSFEGLAVVAILLEFSGDMRYGKSSSQENPNRNSARTRC